MAFAEVNCRICKRPFIAETIQAAMSALKEHEEEQHPVREPEVPVYMRWTVEDLRFLKGLRISPD